MPIIRQAYAYDLAELEQLFLVARRATFVLRSPEEFKIGDYKESVEGEEVWVAECQQQIVGFISWWRPDKFIHNLFIDPDWQKQGIGSLLLKKAEECLGFPLSLKIEMDNLSVGLFYKKNGFEYISTHPEPADYYVLYRKYAP